VKRAGPAQCLVHDASLLAEDLARDPLDPTGHFGSRPAREGHQQDAAGVGTVNNQARDPMGQGVGFSRSGASDDEKRRSDRAVSSNAMFDRSALLRIETRLPTRIAPQLRISDFVRPRNERLRSRR
jgi:hypothetical protein